MFKDSYQGKLLTILSSSGSKPLEIWESHVSHGYINRFLDQEIRALVLEIGGINVSTTYIECPKKGVLGIKMPFLVMIVKNIHKYFAFEVTILDDGGSRRRFRVANFQSSTVVTPTCTKMPICLEAGWNQILFNLADFTRRAYNKHYLELLKVKINANIRIRRIYTANRIYRDEELPPDFKLYASPVKEAVKVQDDQNKENIKPSTSKAKDQTMEENLDNNNMTTFMRRESSSSRPAGKDFGAPRRESSRMGKGTAPKPLHDISNINKEISQMSLGKTSVTKGQKSDMIIWKEASRPDVEHASASRRSTKLSRALDVQDAINNDKPPLEPNLTRTSKAVSVLLQSGLNIGSDLVTKSQTSVGRAEPVENTTQTANLNTPEEINAEIGH